MVISIRLKRGSSSSERRANSSWAALWSAKSNARTRLDRLHADPRASAGQNEDQPRGILEIPLDHYIALYEVPAAAIAGTDPQDAVPEMDRRAGRTTVDGDPPVGHTLLERMAEATRDVLRRAMAPTWVARGDRDLQVPTVAPEAGEEMLRVASLVSPVGTDKSTRPRADSFAQRQSEADLPRADAILELANRAARIGFWEIDFDRSRTTWSAVTREIYELPPGVEPDLASALGFSPTDTGGKRLRAAMAAAVAKGKPYDLELKIATGRGEDRWIRMIGLAEMVDGKCRRLYGTVQDVDARIRAEEARLAQVRAETVDGLKTQVLSQISHELRTPLNAVLGFAQLLTADRDEPLSPRHKYWILHIERAGTQLAILIDDALSSSARDRG